MDVSVVVPVRDAEPYLEACLQSLLRQPIPPEQREILLVDNGSTDRSLEIASRYAPEVRLLRQSEEGSYAARNLGVRGSRGKMLAFTDADCVVDDRWLDRLLAPLRGGRNVMVVLGRREFAARSWPLELLRTYEETKCRHVSGSLRVLHAHTNNMAVRREAFDAIGPFLEIQRGADSLFVRRVVESEGSGAVVYEPDARVRHLEIETVIDYYRKSYIYGRSHRRLERIDRQGRSLNLLERLRLFERAGGSLGTADKALLFGLLAIGGLSFEIGRRIPLPRSATPLDSERVSR